MSQIHHIKIINKMAQDMVQKGKEWFMASDFVLDDIGLPFLGYEASARFSELGKIYPLFIQSRRNGRFIERKIKVENIAPFMDDIPYWMMDIFTDTKLYNPTNE